MSSFGISFGIPPTRATHYSCNQLGRTVSQERLNVQTFLRCLDGLTQLAVLYVMVCELI